MNIWLSTIGRYLQHLAGNPASLPETVLAIGGALLLMIFALKKSADALEFHLATGARATMSVFAVTAICLLLAVTGSRVTIPGIPTDLVRMQPLIFAVAGMLIGIPLIMFLLKGKLPAACFALLISLAAGALVIVLLNGVFHAIRSGGESLGKTRTRTSRVNESIE